MKRKLTQAKRDLSTAFHSMPANEVAGYIENKTFSSLEELEYQIKTNSPFKWMFQGFVIIIFLVICLMLIKYFQITFPTGKDE